MRIEKRPGGVLLSRAREPRRLGDAIALAGMAAMARRSNRRWVERLLES